MSLILEALKKLEREKNTPERGFLVVAQAPWAGGGRRRVWVVAAGILVALALVALWRLQSARPPALPPGPPQAAARVPTTTATVAPPLPTPGAVAQTVVPSLPPIVATGRATPLPPTASERVVPPVAAPRGAVTAPPALAPTPAPPTPAPFRLEAISEQDGVAVAIINGELVREGDHLNGVLIVQIRRQEVVLEIEGQRRLLTF